MPQLTENFLRAQASKTPKSATRATADVHKALARTEAHRGRGVARLESIIKATELQRASLQKQLPALEKAAIAAAGDERSQSHGAYLQAQQNIRQCDQIYNAAKRELIIARNL